MANKANRGAVTYHVLKVTFAGVTLPVRSGTVVIRPDSTVVFNLHGRTGGGFARVTNWRLVDGQMPAPNGQLELQGDGGALCTVLLGARVN